jgi:cell wall-associated NlpC family hydrolase
LSLYASMRRNTAAAPTVMTLIAGAWLAEPPRQGLSSKRSATDRSVTQPPAAADPVADNRELRARAARTARRSADPSAPDSASAVVPASVSPPTSPAAAQPTSPALPATTTSAATPTPTATTGSPRVARPARPSARPARPGQAGAARSVAPPVTASGSAGAVVAFALAQVGKPYRFAASGPSAFDCSGLVAAAYARVGIGLPHQTGGLAGRGRPVARADLRPGDLVFTDPGHVGIYIGGGQMVHAATVRGGVKRSAVYRFAFARRVLY